MLIPLVVLLLISLTMKLLLNSRKPRIPELRQCLAAIEDSVRLCTKFDKIDEKNPVAEISNDSCEMLYWRDEIGGLVKEVVTMDITRYTGKKTETIMIIYVNDNVISWYHNSVPTPGMSISENFHANQILGIIRSEYEKANEPIDTEFYAD